MCTLVGICWLELEYWLWLLRLLNEFYLLLMYCDLWVGCGKKLLDFLSRWSNCYWGLDGSINFVLHFFFGGRCGIDHNTYSILILSAAFFENMVSLTYNSYACKCYSVWQEMQASTRAWKWSLQYYPMES